MLKLVYSLFLGLLIAIFVGVGISTFYESPKAPEYPNTYVSSTSGPNEVEIKDQMDSQKDFDTKQKEWSKKNEVYSRNVALIAVGVAVALITVSILLHPKVDVITDGIMFGGVFTLIYAIIMSSQANNEKFAFGVVTAGLISIIALGYVRFVKDPKAPKPKLKKT